MNVIEQHVLEMIGESIESPDVFTDTTDGMAQIRESINDAIEEIVSLTGSYKSVYHLPLQESQSFYRVKIGNGSFGWVTDAWLVNQKYRLEASDITKMEHNDPRWLEQTGNPDEYAQIGKDVICVRPKPSATSDVLELTCVVIPSRYTSGTDRVKLRDSFKWAAVHYAVSEFWASRGDAASALIHYQRYLENLGMQELYPKGRQRTPYQKTNKWTSETN